MRALRGCGRGGARAAARARAPHRRSRMDIRIRPWATQDVPTVSSLLHEVLAPLARTHAAVARHTRKRTQREIPRGAYCH